MEPVDTLARDLADTATAQVRRDQLVILCVKSGNRHSGLSLPWRTLLLTALALAGYLIPGPAPEAWVFERTAIVEGEFWRLITAHWVHSDPDHAVWDIGAFMLLGMLFEQRLQGKLLLGLAIGTVAVDIWLWWGDPSLQYYCGLSGILNTLLAVGLIQLWRDLHHPLVGITTLGVIMKIGLEIYHGQALLTHTAWPSVPEVHAVGFLCGLVLAATCTAINSAAKDSVMIHHCQMNSRTNGIY